MTDSQINNTVDLRVYYNGYSPERDKAADGIVGKEADGAGCGLGEMNRDLQYMVSPLKAQAVMPKLKAAGFTCEVKEKHNG